MFIAQKAISRRTILRGMGAAIALPMLDSMVPALSAMARTAAFGLPETIDGITDASAIRRFSIPWTLSAASTTELPLVPILHVPTG